MPEPSTKGVPPVGCPFMAIAMRLTRISRAHSMTQPARMPRSLFSFYRSRCVAPAACVSIWNKPNGARVLTYVIFGAPGSRCCILHGAAARLWAPSHGDAIPYRTHP
ncbi:aspartate decarboxylase, partial [Rhodospirillum rubrum]|nr:aspartate decarboxylase [Rhodospirillum rubrum]MBK1678560.1 aspartate decarboxylase [Rhodospirillum rubrum]